MRELLVSLPRILIAPQAEAKQRKWLSAAEKKTLYCLAVAWHGGCACNLVGFVRVWLRFGLGSMVMPSSSEQRLWCVGDVGICNRFVSIRLHYK